MLDGDRGPFAHPALFYRGDQEYLAGLVPFVEDGRRQGDPVAVAVPGKRLALLAAEVDTAGLKMIDMSEAGRNPGRIIPGVLRKFADAHPGRHVRIIGEPLWPGRSAAEYPACAQHEALINLAFAGRDVTIVCPYDVEGLDDRALADAQATHPLLRNADRHWTSPHYSPEQVVADYNLALPAPPCAPSCVVRTATDLAAARRFVGEHGRRLGLAAERAEDLMLIANELATNSLAHAFSSCRLRIWRDGPAVVCESHDSGHLADPLAGRRPSSPEQPGGRGLLLVNHLSDLVRTHTTPAGTTIQVHLSRGLTSSVL